MHYSVLLKALDVGYFSSVKHFHKALYLKEFNSRAVFFFTMGRRGGDI
jgi:hypothetical protein